MIELSNINKVTLIFKLINADIETSITTVALGKYSIITTVCYCTLFISQWPTRSNTEPGLVSRSRKQSKCSWLGKDIGQGMTESNI
jgi:hypothetical protein